MTSDARGDQPTYTWLNVGGQFVVNYDDSTDSIVIRDNSDQSILGEGDFNNMSGNPINLFPFTQYKNCILQPESEYSDYSFCTGTTLNRFQLSGIPGFSTIWPFATKRQELNSSFCTGATCGLTIDSIDVVNESGSGASDGSLTINATTTNTTIQYSLQQFNYPNGQSSNIFSNLPAGPYSVFIADDQNCKASSTITITNQASNQYNALYRFGYKDINGNAGRFEIRQFEYGGSLTEETSLGDPITYENSEKDQFDIFKSPIKAASVTIRLPEDTNFKYRDLYTQDSRKYLGVWEKDTGSGYEEIWRGFLIPEVFVSQYKYKPDVELTFADGLASLDNYKFTGDGTRYHNDFSLIKVISIALKKTGLSLPIRCACNVFEDSQSTGAANDPFPQTYIDAETFYDEKNEPKGLYSILENILKTFCCRIVQWKGYWWIIRAEENGASFNYRNFDADGVYVSNSNYDPRKYLKSASDSTARGVFVNQDASYEILPAPRKIIITNKLDLRESILENYNFIRNNEFTQLPDNWAFYKDDTNVSFRVVKIGDDYVGRFGMNLIGGWGGINLKDVYLHTQSNIQYKTGDKIKFSFDVAVDRMDKTFPYMIIRSRVKIGNYYLDESGEWTTTATDYRSYENAKNGFITVEVETSLPDTTVTVDTTLDVRLYTYQAQAPDFGNYSASGVLSSGETAFRAEPTAAKQVGSIVSVYNVSSTINRLFFYELDEGIDTENSPDVIRPNDFGITTNEKVWKLNKSVPISVIDTPNSTITGRLISNNFFYVKNIIVRVLPSGQEPVEEQIITVDVNVNHLSDYDYSIEMSDLPQVFISSGKYMFKSLFRLSDGTNTQNWNRVGVSESNSIQQIIAKQIVTQYDTPTQKISGTVTTTNINGTHTDIGPVDCLIETQDLNRVYYINGITINDKSLDYGLSLVELKKYPADGETGGGDGGSFSGDFNSDFGAQFDTTYN